VVPQFGKNTTQFLYTLLFLQQQGGPPPPTPPQQGTLRVQAAYPTKPNPPNIRMLNHLPNNPAFPYQQLFTTSAETAHVVGQFPLYYGEVTPLRLWVKELEFANTPSITNLNNPQRVYTNAWNFESNTWNKTITQHKSPTTHQPPIQLLYLNNNPAERRYTLPFLLSLPANATPEQLWSFIHPTANELCPHRLFTPRQRLRLTYLLEQQGIFVTPNWQEPSSASQSSASHPSQSINPLSLIKPSTNPKHETNVGMRETAKQEKLRTKIFELYSFADCKVHYKTPQELITHYRNIQISSAPAGTLAEDLPTVTSVQEMFESFYVIYKHMFDFDALKAAMPNIGEGRLEKLSNCIEQATAK
jgi:hypothetical protein